MMRPRETRRRVIIPSRVRSGSLWCDARIINLSKRGIGLTSATPPDAGTYIEIRRGAHIMIARVIWVNGLRFGVHTQDPVSVDSLVHARDSAGATDSQQTGSTPLAECRRTSREWIAKRDHSRAFGRFIEFAFIAMLAASAAVAGLGLIGQVLQHPLAQVQDALNA